MKMAECAICKAKIQVEETQVPMPPANLGSINVAASVPPTDGAGGMAQGIWCLICTACAKRCVMAIRDPMVAQFLTMMMPWIARLSVELKIAIDKTRARIHPEN